MNPPIRSKINWTSLFLSGIGIAIAMGWIPEDLEKPLSEIALIAGPAVIAVFRTWFTGQKE